MPGYKSLEAALLGESPKAPATQTGSRFRRLWNWLTDPGDIDNNRFFDQLYAEKRLKAEKQLAAKTCLFCGHVGESQRCPSCGAQKEP